MGAATGSQGEVLPFSNENRVYMIWPGLGLHDFFIGLTMLLLGFFFFFFLSFFFCFCFCVLFVCLFVFCLA